MSIEALEIIAACGSWTKTLRSASLASVDEDGDCFGMEDGSSMEFDSDSMTVIVRYMDENGEQVVDERELSHD